MGYDAPHIDAFFTAKDLMKTRAPRKTPRVEAPREPRISCYQTNYSAAALATMDLATGQRTVQSAPTTPKVPVQAVDAD